MTGLTRRKERRETLAQAMASAAKRPRVGWSQGRGPRKDHGARQAARGSPTLDIGVDNATLPRIKGSEPGSIPGSSRGTDRASER